MLARVSIFAIYGYQRYLSPRKGFSCAYRVQNGGTGCSGYAKHAIREHGFLSAVPLIRGRFKACKVAALELSEQRGEDDANKRKPRKRESWFSWVADGCLTAGCFGCASSSATGQSEGTAEGSAEGGFSCGESGCGEPSCGDCSPSCDACSCGG